MPYLPRPTVWQNEIGNIANVSDPKHRLFDELHIPIPFLYRQAYLLARELLNITELNVQYNITKNTESPIIYNDSEYQITEDHNHELLVLCDESQTGLVSCQSNCYADYMSNWGFIWFYYDMVLLILRGNANIDVSSLGYYFLLYISEKNNVDLSSEELLQLILAGLSYYGYYKQLPNATAKKYLKLLEGIRKEFYNRRL